MSRFVTTLVGLYWAAFFAVLAAAAAGGADLPTVMASLASRPAMASLLLASEPTTPAVLSATLALALASALFLWMALTWLLGAEGRQGSDVSRIAFGVGAVIMIVATVATLTALPQTDLWGLMFQLASLVGSYLVLEAERPAPDASETVSAHANEAARLMARDAARQIALARLAADDVLPLKERLSA